MEGAQCAASQRIDLTRPAWLMPPNSLCLLTGDKRKSPQPAEKKRKPREPESSGFALTDNPPKLAGSYTGSPGRTRTADKVVNSHLLCQLSYWGSLDDSVSEYVPQIIMKQAEFVNMTGARGFPPEPVPAKAGAGMTAWAAFRRAFPGGGRERSRPTVGSGGSCPKGRVRRNTRPGGRARACKPPAGSTPSSPGSFG